MAAIAFFFKNNPEAEEVFVTEDGQCFNKANKGHAESHAKSQKIEVREVKRADFKESQEMFDSLNKKAEQEQKELEERQKAEAKEKEEAQAKEEADSKAKAEADAKANAENPEKYKLTADDMERYPELASAGLKEGDEVDLKPTKKNPLGAKK